MATDRDTVTFIVDQSSTDGGVSAKPMFGEHGLYRDGKMFGMICEGRLFIKQTSAGRAFAGNIDEAAPYPGSKPCLLVDADRWDDGDWLAELVRITIAELPLPKPKAPRRPKPG